MWRKRQESQRKESNGPSGKEENEIRKCQFAMLPSRERLENNFEKSFGFTPSDLFHFEKLVSLLYRPTDPASLGVARALFGLCMILDVVEERGLADIDIKWGEPRDCHFPLIHGTRPPPLPWMIVIYSVMWIGAFGIMLGFRFKVACACFVIPYWYIFLLDKSYWNNHTYLYGIVATLFWGTGAGRYFALDANTLKEEERTVPFWNYFILKFQFFALYFLAGLKKSGKEWLDGYSMTNLSRHWVFDPFKMFLTVEQTDYLIVHWFAFVFDLTVGFWMLFDKTRLPAMVFCTAFHLMNSRLFSIGMFPYVCLATMPLFCHVDWPRKLRSLYAQDTVHFLKNRVFKGLFGMINCCSVGKSHRETFSQELRTGEDKNVNLENEKQKTTKHNTPAVSEWNDKIDESLRESTKCKEGRIIPNCGNRSKKRKLPNAMKKQKFVVLLLFFHIFLQLFLPYSHFITKGYNNWVPGLYGYSWDMMVHAWDTVLVVIRVHDNENNVDRYLDPEAWVQNDRWMKHGDMARQYAFCLKDNLMREREEVLHNRHRHTEREKWAELSSNLSIYIDVWCSLNGRFQQRLFNPNVDMLTVDWHPLKPVSYVMPLLTQYNSYRYRMDEIQEEVYTWSNYTDVLFVADFPGMHLDNYISTDFSNVTLTVLEGEVTFTEENQPGAVTVPKGASLPINTGKFHKAKITSLHPACYMYTYTNQTKQEQELNGITESVGEKSALPILKELKYKANAWIRAFSHTVNAFFNLVYGVPMVRRVRVKH